MSSPLYTARIVRREGASVVIHVRVAHPDVHELGTDRHFGWLVLSQWVSPDDPENDTLELARKYVRRVDVSALEDGSIARTAPSFIVVTRRDPEVGPALSYTLEVSDPALIEQVEVGASDDLYEGVSERHLPNPPTPRRLEVTEGGSKFWQGHAEGSELHIAWGKIGTAGQSQVKSFANAAEADAALQKLIAEKTKKGYRDAPSVEGAPVAKAEPKATPPKESPAKATPAQANPAEAGVAAKAARKKKSNDIAPLPLATREDFREKAIELVGEWPTRAPQMLEYLAAWAHTMDDDALDATIANISTAGGFRWGVVARMALLRARAGRAEAATRLVALSETLRTDDPFARGVAVPALIAAQWLLGQNDVADAAFAAWEAELIASKVMANQAAHQLFSIAALGRRTDLVRERLGACLVNDDYRGDLLVPGAIALAEDGQHELLDQLLTRWSTLRAGSTELSRALLKSLTRMGEPERYLALLVQHRVLDRSATVVAMLRGLERLDGGRAADLAGRVLDTPTTIIAALERQLAVAVLARHAPDRAAAWAQGKDDDHPLRSGDRGGYLAALGRGDELRALMASDPTCLRKLVAGAVLALNADLAKDVARELLRAMPFAQAEWALVVLARLGEREPVDAVLDDRLAEVAALPPKNRDLNCRSLARVGARLGRYDLGLAAMALPAKGVRRYSAIEMVRGAAQAGDWTSALGALALDTEAGANGPVSTALQALEIDDERDFDPLSQVRSAMR